MIKEMVIAVPQERMDRSWYPKDKLTDFISQTGISNTWRTTKSTKQLICSALNCMDDYKVQAIIVVTQSPDRSCPAMAYDVANKWGCAGSIPLFDVNQACAGFVYGLYLASKIKGDVLLVAADKIRMRMDEPESNKLIFSDAAVAAIVNFDNLPVKFMNDPSGVEFLKSNKEGLLGMNGGAVFDFVVRKVPGLIHAYEEENGKSDLMAQHQANMAMMKFVEKRSGYQLKSLHSIGTYGNMSMVSIPMAIAMNEKQALGKKILMVGYGAGWSAAVTSVRWSEKEVCRIVTA